MLLMIMKNFVKIFKIPETVSHERVELIDLELLHQFFVIENIYLNYFLRNKRVFHYLTHLNTYTHANRERERKKRDS